MTALDYFKSLGMKKCNLCQAKNNYQIETDNGVETTDQKVIWVPLDGGNKSYCVLSYNAAKATLKLNKKEQLSFVYTLEVVEIDDCIFLQMPRTLDVLVSGDIP